MKQRGKNAGELPLGRSSVEPVLLDFALQRLWHVDAASESFTPDADVHAFGSLLHHMLTGREQRTTASDEPTLELPANFAMIIRRAAAKHVDGGFADLLQFADALEQVRPEGK